VGLPKFTGPLKPPPSWLDPAARVTGPEPPKLSRDAFPVMCVDTLLSLGCPIVGACEIAANAVTETGWGQEYRANNLGGWKCSRGAAERYKARTGQSMPWWTTHGNAGTGDSQTVFYRAFPSVRDFFAEWLLTFVPKPGTVGPTHLYKRTGEVFWSGGDWFPELIRGGYKGRVTKANPDKSIAEHVSLTNSARTRWAQSRLGVTVDGKLGPKTRTALTAFQKAHGPPPFGEVDTPTIMALSAHTSPTFAV
jgi:peptidoglycan hydrolase-like protein with peptidoglycan-binding domain